MKYGGSLQARFLIPLAKPSPETAARVNCCVWACVVPPARVTCARRKAVRDGIRAGNKPTVDGSGSVLHPRSCWHLMDENQAPVSTILMLFFLKRLSSGDEPRTEKSLSV